jgi:hypothetical protein
MTATSGQITTKIAMDAYTILQTILLTKTDSYGLAVTRLEAEVLALGVDTSRTHMRRGCETER